MTHPYCNQSPRVLVLGDLMIDHYLWGATTRISPEAPVPVVDVQREGQSLGGAGNVVNNLLSLGADVSLLSVVGDDDTGQQVRAMLDALGVDARGVACEAERRTPRKTRVMAGGQQMLRIDCETRCPIVASSEQKLHSALATVPGEIGAVVISDYAKGTCTPSVTQAVVEWAKGRGVPVLVDPKGSDGEKYRGVSVITPNRKEAAQLGGIEIVGAESLHEAGQALRTKLEIDWAVITLSEEGLAVIDDEMLLVRASAREVYDVTGAGDTVLAMIGFVLACGGGVPEAARLAKRAAAVVVGKLGAATASWDEVLDQHESRRPKRGVVGRAEIAAIAELIRRSGRKIVFTNGCFDLLHRGHVEYLRASAACGDVLVVGVNSDESVKNLKGPARPIVPEADRVALLAALDCVDYVVLFDEETPRELIRQVRPDVLTKGSDYVGREIAGAEFAGEVRLIDFIEGCSTTDTIQRIRQAA